MSRSNTEEADNALKLADDWLMTLVCMFASMGPDDNRPRGITVADALRILNIDKSQLGIALWEASRSFSEDVNGAPLWILAPEKPGSRELKRREGKRLFPDAQNAGEWRTSDRSDVGDLRYHAKTLKSTMYIPEDDYCLEQCVLFLDAKLSRSKLEYLLPTNLESANDVMLRRISGLRPEDVDSIHPYGCMPVMNNQTIRKNIDSFASAIADSVVVDAQIGSIHIEGVPTRIYPMDSRGQIIGVMRTEFGTRVVDLAAMGKSGRNATCSISAVGHSAPDVFYSYSFAQSIDESIDYWDVPENYGPPKDCNLMHDLVLRFKEVVRDDGKTGNVLNRLMELKRRPGKLTLYDQDGNVISQDAKGKRTAKAFSATYISKTTYTAGYNGSAHDAVASEGGLQRFILSFGSNCLVESPFELQRWHIEGSWERLKRLSQHLP